MTKRITVTWKNGFTMSYKFEYATPERVQGLLKHYDSLSWIESVKVS